MRTAPEALEALAGLAEVQAQTGALEQALALLTLVLTHPSTGQETKDRVAGLAAALRAALSAEQVEAALARGREMELWAIVAMVSAGQSREANFTKISPTDRVPYGKI